MREGQIYPTTVANTLDTAPTAFYACIARGGRYEAKIAERLGEMTWGGSPIRKNGPVAFMTVVRKGSHTLNQGGATLENLELSEYLSIAQPWLKAYNITRITVATNDRSVVQEVRNHRQYGWQVVVALILLGTATSDRVATLMAPKTEVEAEVVSILVLDRLARRSKVVIDHIF